VVWCIIWIIVVKEAPRYDPYISKKELEFIEASIGNQPDEVKVVVNGIHGLTKNGGMCKNV